MIDVAEVLDPLQARGFDASATVPCSVLGSLLDRLEDSEAFDHVSAVNEGDAIAIAAGAWLAGRRPMVAFQNSGLGNAVNPLTSLSRAFAIPMLLLISWRGRPGAPDAPQHHLMGSITPALLELMGIPHEVLGSDGGRAGEQVERLLAVQADGRGTVALVIPRGTFLSSVGSHAPYPTPPAPLAALGERPPRLSDPPSRQAALERVLAVADRRTAILSTTGKCSRELYHLADRPGNFYQVGSMGCVGALGLGVARWSRRPVIVLDGDGALLMRLGALTTVGVYAPRSLVHVLLDNGVHDSTGGQATASPHVDLAAMAAASGYRAVRCRDLHGFEASLRRALSTDGPHFLHLETKRGSPPELGRPSMPLADLASRFREFITEAAERSA